MGPKLAVLAAVTLAQVASADPASDLKQGIDLYKVGKYADAIVALKHAYDAAPKPETLFALAQAERLNGDCTIAAQHYHQVIEQVSDINVAKLVEQNLVLCEKIEPKPEPKPAAAPAPMPAPPPQTVTKTVVHDVFHLDPLAASLSAAGALALGAAGGLYVAAAANRNAAGEARTLDDHNALANHADNDEKAMFVAASVGVALFGVATYRWIWGANAPKSDVAVTPTRGGASLSVTSRW